MSKRNLALLLSILTGGCATGQPTVDQVESAPKQVITLAPIREALGNYHDCLRENVKAYLKAKAKPKQIANTVAGNCEPELTQYQLAVREVYAQTLNPAMAGYADMLVSKPEIHANRVREKGKLATVERVTAARTTARQHKTAARSRPD